MIRNSYMSKHRFEIVELPKTPIRHLVVDIETLSFRQDAAIVAIGAVGVTPNNTLSGAFYVPVNFQSNMDAGLAVDGQTLTWWMNLVKETGFSPEDMKLDLIYGLQLHVALKKFNAFVEYCDLEYQKTLPENNKGKLVLWGNGSDFDLAILLYAMRAARVRPQWNYWQQQSLRTLGLLASMYRLPVKRMREENEHPSHYALDDAMKEAVYLANFMSYFKEIKGEAWNGA